MKKRLVVWGTTIVIFFSSCTKKADGIQGPAGPAGTDGQPTGQARSAISGYVRLKDQFANVDSAFDQVTVSTHMGDSLISSITDGLGKFTLANLKSGTYRILLQKTGYDSIAFNTVHSAGNEDKFVGDLEMVESLSAHFVSQDLKLDVSPFDPAYNVMTITTTITGPLISNSTKRALNFYFSKSPDLNRNNSMFETEGYSSGDGINYIVSYAGFQSTNINDNNFKTGDTVYMKTYFVPNPSLLSSWFDTNTYQTVPYPYVGDSLRNYFIWKN